MFCPICKKDCKNIKSLIRHASIHGHNTKSLYDNFYKKENEEFCINCKKQTKYKSFDVGYNKFCSVKCSNSINVNLYWNSNTIQVIERKEKNKENFKKYQNKSGRPKGSKNKNPYPKTDKVLERFEKNKPPSWKNKKHKEETKEKISIKHKGKIFSLETKNKMSETRSKKILTGEIILNNNKNYIQGKFKPKNPQKYKGNPQNIVYRSSYELKFMNYCDLNESVLEYQSEEFFILYKDPFSGSTRRYFPDFFVKYKDKTGTLRKLVVEIKPKKDLKEPDPNPKRRTKSWVYSVKTWAVNQAKWKAAKEYCADRNYEFRILTEQELGIGK